MTSSVLLALAFVESTLALGHERAQIPTWRFQTHSPRYVFVHLFHEKTGCVHRSVLCVPNTIGAPPSLAAHFYIFILRLLLKSGVILHLLRNLMMYDFLCTWWVCCNEPNLFGFWIHSRHQMDYIEWIVKMTVLWQRLDNVPHLKGKNYLSNPHQFNLFSFFSSLSERSWNKISCTDVYNTIKVRDR